MPHTAKNTSYTILASAIYNIVDILGNQIVIQS